MHFITTLCSSFPVGCILPTVVGHSIFDILESQPVHNERATSSHKSVYLTRHPRSTCCGGLLVQTKMALVTTCAQIGAVDKPHQIFRLTGRRLTI